MRSLAAVEIRAAGFEVEEDSGMADWAKRFAQVVPAMRAGYFSRIAVARC